MFPGHILRVLCDLSFLTVHCVSNLGYAECGAASVTVELLNKHALL